MNKEIFQYGHTSVTIFFFFLARDDVCLRDSCASLVFDQAWSLIGDRKDGLVPNILTIARIILLLIADVSTEENQFSICFYLVTNQPWRTLKQCFLCTNIEYRVVQMNPFWALELSNLPEIFDSLSSPTLDFT